MLSFGLEVEKEEESSSTSGYPNVSLFDEPGTSCPEVRASPAAAPTTSKVLRSDFWNAFMP
jgi:hypothetical protein